MAQILSSYIYILCRLSWEVSDGSFSLLLQLLVNRVLIALIQDMGTCPCPHCTLPKDSICGMGTKADKQLWDDLRRKDTDKLWEKVEKAHKIIYKDGYAVISNRVEQLLKTESLVPTKVYTFVGAESTKKIPRTHSLSHLETWDSMSLNCFQLIFCTSLTLVFRKLSWYIWLESWTHSVRIKLLYSMKGRWSSSDLALLSWLHRFQAVPTFRESTIRWFAQNVSELKKLAARDYEDILQVSS